mgnify:CR=1 FL=1
MFSSSKSGATVAGLITLDLDGTLVNTIYDLGASVDYALSSLGYPKRSIEEYTRFVGNGTLKLIERSLPDGVKDDKDIVSKAHDIFSSHYSKHYLDLSRPYPGIMELLLGLKDLGFVLCVSTNKPDAFARSIAKSLFPEDMFYIVRGAVDGVRKKPDPQSENEIITSCLERFGKGIKSLIIHVGDSDVDVLTAKNAGIISIGCSWGSRPKESLLASGADYLADSPCDVMTAVRSLLPKV